MVGTHGTPQGVRLREGTLADLDAVLDLLNESARWLLDRGIRQWFVPFPRTLIEDDLRDHRVFLATTGNDVIGTATALTTDPMFWGDQPPGSWYVHRLARRHRRARYRAHVAELDRGVRSTGRCRANAVGLQRSTRALLRGGWVYAAVVYESARLDQHAPRLVVVLLREVPLKRARTAARHSNGGSPKRRYARARRLKGAREEVRVAIEKLSELIGRTLLVGIEYFDSDGRADRQIQFAGIVVAMEPR